MNTNRPILGPVLILGAAFFALTLLSIGTFRWSEGLPVLWPAPGLLLAFLAVYPRQSHVQFTIAAAVGGFAAMALFGWSVPVALAMALIAIGEEICAFALLNRVRNGKIDWFKNLDGLVAFFLIAGVLTPSLFALPATLLGPSSGLPFGITWLAWLGADGLGALIVTPLAYLLLNGSVAREWNATSESDRKLIVGAVLTVTLTTALVFVQNVGPLLFLPFFPLIIAAFKAERVGALLSVSGLALVATAATWSGTGPIAAMVGSQAWSVQFLQMYVATALLTSLPAGVELKQRRVATRKLHTALDELTASEKKAQQVANTDTLTGLANRRGFMATLNRAVGSRRPMLLAILDLDDFKCINDKWGHLVGDELLRRVGARLSDAVGGTGTLARLGGNEFAFLADPDEETTPEDLAEALILSLDQPIAINEEEFLVASSCGLVVADEDEKNTTSRMLTQADVALFNAKRQPGTSWEVFSAEMEEEEERKAIILEKLASPEGREEIRLVYQPIFDLVSRRIATVEALARWDCPELGPVTPDQFIPLAERGRLIRPLTWHLLDIAIEDCRDLPHDVKLSFNVSAQQFCDDGFAAELLRALERKGFDPARLKLEVTETTLLNNSVVGAWNCKCLQEAGARIVLDDFGAGYASVSYLRTLRFNEIKLDGSLTIVASSQEGNMLAKGVLEMCKTLGIDCTAEHLETQWDVERFRALGCKFGQGYYLSRPMEADKLVKMLEEKGAWALSKDVA